MRPIDADVFKEYIDAHGGRLFIGCTVGEAMKILIDEQPTAQPEVLACGNGELVAKPEPQWIPVSERLPETEEFVLASLTGKYRNTTFEHACEIADYADGEWCVYAYPGMSAEKCAELIEAWMPLPEPYKPNKKTKW